MQKLATVPPHTRLPRREEANFCNFPIHFFYITKILNVMPEPVGPINKTLLFSSSTTSVFQQLSAASVWLDSAHVLIKELKSMVN